MKNEMDSLEEEDIWPWRCMEVGVAADENEVLQYCYLTSSPVDAVKHGCVDDGW